MGRQGGVQASARKIFGCKRLNCETAARVPLRCHTGLPLLLCGGPPPLVGGGGGSILRSPYKVACALAFFKEIEGCTSVAQTLHGRVRPATQSGHVESAWSVWNYS